MPFDLVWWGYVYDGVRGHLPDSTTQVFGTAGVVIVAFAFWFVAIPAVFGAWRPPRQN
jgi:hypothetical protein